MPIKIKLNPEQIERLNRLAETPDEDSDFSDMPPSKQDFNGVVGLHTLPPNEYHDAMKRIRSQHAKARLNPPAPPIAAPPHKIRYAHEDMDTTIRHCAKKDPAGVICDESFHVSDYPVGYYPFKEQVHKGSYASTCPICEIKALKRMLKKPNDGHSRLSLQADLDLLEPHHNAR